MKSEVVIENLTIAAECFTAWEFAIADFANIPKPQPQQSQPRNSGNKGMTVNDIIEHSRQLLSIATGFDARDIKITVIFDPH